MKCKYINLAELIEDPALAVKEDEKLLWLVDGEIRMKKKNKEITSTSQLMQALGTMGEVLARADQREDVTFCIATFGKWGCCSYSNCVFSVPNRIVGRGLGVAPGSR